MFLSLLVCTILSGDLGPLRVAFSLGGDTEANVVMPLPFRSLPDPLNPPDQGM